jgi:hypothetical protein
MENRTLLASFTFQSVYSSTPSGGWGADAGSEGEVVGDFNRDGKLDVAITGAYGLAVMDGNGDGTFSLDQTWQLDSGGGIGNSLAEGDFQGNGNLDLVVADTDNSFVDVFLGDAKGDFQQSSYHCTDAGSVLVGDVIGNGTEDIVWSSAAGIGLLLGNGKGTFTAGPSIASNTGEAVAALADFNGDGADDLLTTQYGTGSDGSEDCSLFMRLSNGDGTFSAPQNILTIPDTDGGSVGVQAGQLTSDGKIDLVVKDISSSFGSGGIDVLLGNGNGTFKSPIQHSLTGGDPTGFALGDFNGDGKLDVATYLFRDGGLNILLGNGDGTLEAPIAFDANGSPAGLVPGDFTGDGRTDLVGIVSDDPSLNALINIPSPNPTSTGVDSGPSPSVYGQSVTFGAQVKNLSPDDTTSPTGGVQFYVDGSPYGSPVTLNDDGAALIQDANLPAGSHQITADFLPANGDFSASSSPTAAIQEVQAHAKIKSI